MSNEEPLSVTSESVTSEFSLLNQQSNGVPCRKYCEAGGYDEYSPYKEHCAVSEIGEQQKTEH